MAAPGRAVSLRRRGQASQLAGAAGLVQRRSLFARLVRPMLVVMPRVLGQDPVPPEYSIIGLTCCIGCAPGAVMVGWPGVSEDPVPADALAIWAGGAGVPRGSGEGR